MRIFSSDLHNSDLHVDMSQKNNSPFINVGKIIAQKPKSPLIQKIN